MRVKISQKQKSLMKDMAEESIQEGNIGYTEPVVSREGGFSEQWNIAMTDKQPKFSAKEFKNNTAAEIIYPA